MVPKGLLLQFLPPFSVVARFFVTAPLFGIAGTLITIYFLSKGFFNPLPAVHAFTLGFMAMTMLGALFQMLPVVAGATIKNPQRKAWITHVGLTLGVVLFVGGSLFYRREFTLVGALILFLTLYYTAGMMFLKLLRTESNLTAVRGMKFALLNFLMGLTVAVLLTLNLGGYADLPYWDLLLVHVAFMLVGWVFLLIASVSFQVIEMFFVTPPYPSLVAKFLPPLVTAFVLLKSFFPTESIFAVPLSILMIAYGIVTLDRLQKRRRKVKDPIVYLWRTGMVLLLISALLYPTASEDMNRLLVFLIVFGSFSLSIIMAMMYRIIPFLVWIHLTNAGDLNPPTIYEVITRKRVYANFFIHLVAIAFGTGALLLKSKELGIVCGVVVLLSFCLLLFNLSSGVLLYVRRVAQKGASPPPL